jgi:enoyl-CoA hydratase/carnithine racemase
MDLARLDALFGLENGAEEMVGDVAEFQRLFARIEVAPFISIAKIAGVAFGGGLELALACDLRVASSKARLGLPEAKLGLIPGAGGTQRLTKLCGRGTAGRIILTGDAIDAATALSLGILQWVFEPEELDNGVTAIIERTMSMSRFALREAKQLIAAACDHERDGYHEEREADRSLFGQGDTKLRIKGFLSGAR